jgi:acetylornithine deacetylase/succinyl-diaminopimelate desuccinylase-like protein
MKHALVETRRRAVARMALYGSLLLVGLATAAAHRWLHLPGVRTTESRWKDVVWEDHAAVRLLQQLIRVDTSPGGDELAAALMLATPLEAAGFEVHVERLGDRQANLWAILEGDDPQALVLLNHLDVEPAEAGHPWQHPPFSGVVEGPWVHGRGAFDMKSYTVAQLMAALDLAARHPRPARTLIFLATSSEERGSDLGMRWLIREHPDLVGRFWAVITEGGVVEARSLEDVKYWGTEVGQRRYPTVTACARSRERLEQLRADIRAHDDGFSGITIDPAVRSFWTVYEASRDRVDLQEALERPDDLTRDPARFLDLPGYLRAMVRSDVGVGDPEPAPGGGWQMRITFGLLPGADLAAVTAARVPDWMTGGVTLAPGAAALPAASSPVDHEVMRAIAEEARRQLDVSASGPFFLVTTATDARFLRPLGIPSYGFSPFFILTPDTLRIGLPNERISAPGLAQGAELQAAVVRRLAGPG